MPIRLGCPECPKKVYVTDYDSIQDARAALKRHRKRDHEQHDPDRDLRADGGNP